MNKICLWSVLSPTNTITRLITRPTEGPPSEILNLREHLKELILLFARDCNVLVVAHDHVATIAPGKFAHVLHVDQVAGMNAEKV